ncbi:MAG: TolC family protein [Fimbriimonadia bacterium]
MVLGMAAALAALSTVALQQSPQMLTLDQAIGIALENSLSVRRARAELAKSREQVNQGYAAMRPQVTGSATYTRFDKKTTAEFPGQDPDGNSITQSIVIQPEDSRTAQVVLGQAVDISGKQRIGVRGAKALETAAHAGLSAEEAEVALRVKLAYYNVLRAQASVAIAEDAVKNAEERQRVAEAQVEAGTASKIDVLRAKTQVAQNRQGLISARNAVALAKAAFNNVLARAVDTPFELAPAGDLPQCRGKLDALTAEAFEKRPELRQLEWVARVQESVLSLERLGMMPSLTLSVVGDFNFRTTLFNNRSERYTGAAVLSFPLYDGNITKARVGQAKADVEKSRASFEEAKLGVALQVKQALLSVQEASERLVTAEAALAEAEEVLRLAQLRYKNELAIQLEVSDAELALTQAKLNALNARYDYLQAYSQLQRAVGSEDV